MWQCAVESAMDGSPSQPGRPALRISGSDPIGSCTMRHFEAYDMEAK